MAACDNFRSGAVEQLKTHGRCLKIPVFDKGYSGDISAICEQAINEAKKLKKDIVLIDTAGRMQDNEMQMRELANLIEDNKPQLVFFVGEALVGNNAIDQINKFSSTLSKSLKENPHNIDGVILTKFDTVDDKVGAAINMIYISGKPIVFVGVGQKYPDLRKLDIEAAIKLLLH